MSGFMQFLAEGGRMSSVFYVTVARVIHRLKRAFLIDWLGRSIRLCTMLFTMLATLFRLAKVSALHQVFKVMPPQRLTYLYPHCHHRYCTGISTRLLETKSLDIVSDSVLTHHRLIGVFYL